MGNAATKFNVEVLPHNRLSLRSGYGSDDGGGHTADNLIYLTNRFGPISSFSGSYRADRWTVNIERSPGNYAHHKCADYAKMISYFGFISTACNSSEPPKCKQHIVTYYNQPLLEG